jgi:hypothetical protein
MTTVGTYGVGLAAAVLSFDSLRGLAELLGFREQLTPLFPIAVDMYAAVVTRVWLGAGRHGRRVRAWAQLNAWLAIALSVAGNALYHALIAGYGAKKVVDRATGAVTYHVNPVIIVLVSAVPPVVLGLVVHLRTLITFERNTEKPAPAAPSPTPVDVDRPGGAEVVDAEPVDDGPGAALLPAQLVVDEALSFADGAERKAHALAELARLAAGGVDLSAAGFNQAMAVRYGVTVSSVEKWKQAWQRQQANALPPAMGRRG